MTWQIALILILVLATVVNFLLEFLTIEVFALSLMGSLILFGLLSPEQAFQGFSNPAVIMIAGAMVMTGSIIHNGAADLVARGMHATAGRSRNGIFLLLLGTVTSMSAFINNVAATAMFIPVAEGISKRSRVNPRHYLMPLAFASMLGGVCTLIGTSTNVAVSGALAAYRLEPLGMFELTPLGLVIAPLGIAYLFLFSRFLLPKEVSEDRVADYGIRDYLFEIQVEKDSPITGLTIAASDLALRFNLSILGIFRGPERILSPTKTEIIRAGDLLLVEGNVPRVMAGRLPRGLTVKMDPRLSGKDLESEGVRMVEATVSYNSPFIGRNLRDLNFRLRYELNVLALYRRGEAVVEKVGKISLREGDVLLIQGREDQLVKLLQEPTWLLIEDVVLPKYNPGRSLRALLVFGSAIGLGSLGIVPIPVAFLLGAVLTIVLRCFTFEEAERYLNLKLVLIVASMLSVSMALETTGAAAYLARHTVNLLQGFGPLALLAGFFLLTVLLTQPMSNSAAALLMVPIGIHAARLIGSDPRPFIVAIAVAASCSFLTPLEPAYLLVFSTGKYHYADFLKFGLGLTFLVFILCLAFIPRIWPL